MLQLIQTGKRRGLGSIVNPLKTTPSYGLKISRICQDSQDAALLAKTARMLLAKTARMLLAKTARMLLCWPRQPGCCWPRRGGGKGKQLEIM